MHLPPRARSFLAASLSMSMSLSLSLSLMPLAAATGCAAVTAPASTPAPSCARLDLPHREDTERVRCPDGQQRYVERGAVVSLIDVCYQARRFPAKPATAGAFCLRPASVERVADADPVHLDVTVEPR